MSQSWFEEALSDFRKVYDFKKQIYQVELEKHNDISEFSTVDPNDVLSLLRHTALSYAAECSISKSKVNETDTIVTDERLLLDKISVQLQIDVHESKELLLKAKAERSQLLDKNNKLNEMLANQRQTDSILTKRLAEFHITSDETDPCKKLEERLKKLKMLEDRRIVQLKDFVNQYYPTPSKNGTTQESDEGVSDATQKLSETFDEIIQAYKKNRVSCWASVDNMWPPYIELLLLSDIAERNRDNASCIRLIDVCSTN